MSKNKDLLNKLERDLKSLQTNINKEQKEKSQLREDFKRRLELDYRSN